MANDKKFNVLIVVTPEDCQRLMKMYPILVDKFPYGKVCFVGRKEVGEIATGDAVIGSKVLWVDEESIVSFDAVHSCMSKKLETVLNGQPLARGITGWYYQQFLKMQYSAICPDEYYMVWDGDTLPCREINMFSTETGQPYIDLKHEYHPEYFETMGKILPGFRKVIERSFISEHMLIKTDIMRQLICDIEKNNEIEGHYFWEKIINCIEPEKIYDSSFSEFETYGTYVALKFPSVYRLREWHSFRLGGSFFDINTISERDFNWLAKDFDAISFEKGQEVSEDNKNLFDNPEYQNKLSAKQMLQAAQMEYKDGYKEIWEDDLTTSEETNVRVGGYHQSNSQDKKILIVVVSYNGKHFMEENLKSIRKVLAPGSYKIAVVDNASTDGVDKWLAQQDDIIFIRNEQNLGFAPACNQAVAATVGTEYEDYDVFLLNNDTRLVYDALYFLQRALYSRDDIGAVGSVSNYAGNKQMLDVEFDSVEEFIEYGEKINVPMENAYLERVRLCGFAMLIRRNVWDEIGGFDEDFVPGYFEDDALCMEMMRRGYRMLVVRNSFIYHAGSESFIKTDFNSILNKNHELFKKKYGFDVMKYAYPSGTVISQIPYGNNDRFRVLQYGCGLGSEMKAIKSLFPNCECVGVETNPNMYSIVKMTENVYPSAEELFKENDKPSFNVFISDDKTIENMDMELNAKLTGLLLPNSSVIIKYIALEDFSYEKIKLIIWDMDNTFWQGILSEGEVILPMSNVELIKNITDHGVVNSISSKNDESKVIEELEKAGIADLFVFNNINWEEKGAQIAQKIKNMNLRPENVLFIDDDVRNLEQARYYCEGLMIATPVIITYLTTFFLRTEAKDPKHDRLAHYKLLESKQSEEKTFDSEEEFLLQSDIRITVNKNCLEEIDRIQELVMRSNQLNYTKNRDHKELLIRFITNDWYDCAYIKAQDKYGDYGIIGFYCINTRNGLVEHFLFSCRVLGMGIEQYIYNKLGCPDIEVKPNVSIELSKNKDINWITEVKELEIVEDSIKAKRARVLLKGPCDLDQIAPYLGGGSITTEFNYINENGVITTGQNHSMHIWEAGHMSDEEIKDMIKDVPFISEGDFKTKIFTEEYHVICYSLLQDCCAGLYRNKKTDKYLGFSSVNYSLTDPALKERFISKEINCHDFQFTEDIIDNFSKEWEFVGNTPIDLLMRNLDYIYDNVKGKPLIILILGSETDYEGEDEEFVGCSQIYREINPIITEFAEDHERMRILNITDFISSQEDFRGCINHYTKNVYYKISGAIAEYINEAISRRK